MNIYKDYTLPDILEYGFPCGYKGKKRPTVDVSNHSSAMRNPMEIKQFLGKEKAHQAVASPFKESPFTGWFRSNPIAHKAKKRLGLTTRYT